MVDAQKREWIERITATSHTFYMEDQSEVYVQQAAKGQWVLVRHPHTAVPTSTPEVVAGPFKRLDDALNAYVLMAAGV